MDYCDVTLEDDFQMTDFNDCVTTGTRWTIIYKFCFAISLIFTINALIMTVGTWNYQARMLGSCLFGLT